MRNETQMIKHFTCFRSSEQMSDYSNSATTRFIVKNSLFVLRGKDTFEIFPT